MTDSPTEQPPISSVVHSGKCPAMTRISLVQTGQRGR